MSVHEAGILVEILALDFDKISFETPIQALDMLLNVINHRLPLGLLLVTDVPALMLHIVACLGQDARIVHHFLGDAANIDACADQTPLHTLRGRGHKVS